MTKLPDDAREKFIGKRKKKKVVPVQVENQNMGCGGINSANSFNNRFSVFNK